MLAVLTVAVRFTYFASTKPAKPVGRPLAELFSARPKAVIDRPRCALAGSSQIPVRSIRYGVVASSGMVPSIPGRSGRGAHT